MHGKGVSSGIAIGEILFHNKGNSPIFSHTVKDTKAECKRFDLARTAAINQVKTLGAQVKEQLGEENSLLFDIHIMLLEDLDFLEAVTDKIQGENICAEYAVEQAAQRFAALMRDTADEYMRERAADILDIGRRLLDILLDRNQGIVLGHTPCILVAEDLLPSETAQLDRSKVLALATAKGAATSHTAIFARTMGIPAVIGLGDALNAALSGKSAALDGETGEVLVEPEPAALQRFTEKKQRLEAEARLQQEYRGQPTRTQGGRHIQLFANIGCVEDADLAVQSDAEGIGLFRSEFLFLEGKDYPAEERQFAAYRGAAEKMEGKPVIIRTLDIGADKQANYFGLPQEENPAMGMRAIRICLTRPEVFITQLRALYRSSAYGDIRIMLPMITSLSEIHQAKRYIDLVRQELREEAIPFREQVPLGIMIETPASAVISDLLAKEVDFFSIGTNDLTQYTLAVDRQNDLVAQFCDTRHEAILRLIAQVVKNAHNQGIKVGICGELGADLTLTERFIEMGIDEISVPPAVILAMRGTIAQLQ